MRHSYRWMWNFGEYQPFEMGMHLAERHYLLKRGHDIARRFALTMIILVATPLCLTRYGAPESPEDLYRFRDVVLVERGSRQPWTSETVRFFLR